MNDFLKISLIVASLAASFSGMVFGAIDSIERKCTYSSIASYFPPYVLACELFKERWVK